MQQAFRHLAVVLFLFFLSWTVSSSEKPCAPKCYQSLQLTKESLNSFTIYLTGGSTDTQSIVPPAGLAAETSNWKLWTKYVIGSAVVLGSVDRCALSVIRRLWNENEIYLMGLLKELAKNNDLGTVLRFIAENSRVHFWNTGFGSYVVGLVKGNWNAMRPFFERVLAILKESGDKCKEYRAMIRCMPIELQYEMINSGKISLDDIDKVYLVDMPPYSSLRGIFVRARCSPTPNPAIREYIAERVPWFKQFMPDAPSKFKDTAVTSILEPGHDMWTIIRGFMDVETLIFVLPLVCQTWNKSYSRILAEDTRIHEMFLQDLNHVTRYGIHTIAPWDHFLNEANSAPYLGQCIISGALDRIDLDSRANHEIIGYLRAAVREAVLVPKGGKENTLCESFARLIGEGYKAYPRERPCLFKPSFLTDEEYEKVIHHLICEEKLVVKISYQWIVENIPRIYSVLGEDQVLIRRVIELSTDYQEALFIWIMVGQACGITEKTAKWVFSIPGIFAQKFISPVFVKPSEYYNYIAESGMLFEMMKICYGYTEYDASTLISCLNGLNHLMISLILFFKSKPDKIEHIVASVASKLPTLDLDILERMRGWFGTGTMTIIVRNGRRPLEDVEFVKRVLTRCGLLDESGI